MSARTLVAEVVPRVWLGALGGHKESSAEEVLDGFKGI